MYPEQGQVNYRTATGTDQGPTSPLALIARTLAVSTIDLEIDPLVFALEPVTNPLAQTCVALERFTSYCDAPCTVPQEMATRF